MVGNEIIVPGFDATRDLARALGRIERSGESASALTQFHRAVAEAIGQSEDFDDFVERLQDVAKDWLPHGAADLPPGLRR